MINEWPLHLDIVNIKSKHGSCEAKYDATFHLFKTASGLMIYAEDAWEWSPTGRRAEWSNEQNDYVFPEKA